MDGGTCTYRKFEKIPQMTKKHAKNYATTTLHTCTLGGRGCIGGTCVQKIRKKLEACNTTMKSYCKRMLESGKFYFRIELSNKKAVIKTVNDKIIDKL